VHTASAAALPSSMQTIKKNPLKSKIDQKMFSKKDMDAWRNPCGADGYDGEGRTAFVDRVDAYEEVSFCLGVQCEILCEHFHEFPDFFLFSLFPPFLIVLSLFADQKKRRRSQSRAKASRQNQHHKYNKF
jgi:hypothetical protein